MNVIIVTGASAGMGSEYVKQIYNLNQQGISKFSFDELWIVARNGPVLQDLATSLGNNVVPIVLDLSLPDSPNKIADMLKSKNANLKMLINNAGYAKFGAFENIDLTDHLGIIDLNIKSLTNMCHRLLHSMSSGSHLVNVASSAGFVPSHKFNVYAATKAYVLHFTIGLWYELKPKGISVTVVCPGAVQTNFFNVAGHRPEIESRSSKSADVVSTALKDIKANRLYSVHSFSIQAFLYLIKFLPKTWLVKLI